MQNATGSSECSSLQHHRTQGAYYFAIAFSGATAPQHVFSCLLYMRETRRFWSTSLNGVVLIDQYKSQGYRFVIDAGTDAIIKYRHSLIAPPMAQDSMVLWRISCEQTSRTRSIRLHDTLEVTTYLDCVELR